MDEKWVRQGPYAAFKPKFDGTYSSTSKNEVDVFYAIRIEYKHDCKSCQRKNLVKTNFSNEKQNIYVKSLMDT